MTSGATRCERRAVPTFDGGRLTWRPYYRSSKIIADINGRFVATPDGVSPGAFEFALSLHPSVLILSTEPASQSGLDPLISGFLAQLTAERKAMPVRGPLQQLIAA